MAAVRPVPSERTGKFWFMFPTLPRSHGQMGRSRMVLAQKSPSRFLVAPLLVVGIAGCALVRPWNVYGPVGHQKSEVELLEAAPRSSMGMTVVGLACSGGGSRAAYLTMAVLREIHRDRLRLNLPRESERERDLLDQIDYISGVSGGALSAAYFVLNKQALQEPWDGRAWKDYSRKMTIGYRRRQWYWLGLANPWSWLRWALTNFNRGVIARDDYDHILYSSATIADLPDRPSLAVSATDAFTGEMFIFSNRPVSDRSPITSVDLFKDRIDPQSVRVADAVYASSAFPFIYPVFALNRSSAYGRIRPRDSDQRFLSDGGLRDNSGLATLHQQMAAEFYRQSRHPVSPTPRLALAISIDASVDKVSNRSAYDWTRGENYAWRDTYLRHGQDSVGAAIDLHEQGVRDKLRMRGWTFVDHLDPEGVQPFPEAGNAEGGRSHVDAAAVAAEVERDADDVHRKHLTGTVPQRPRS